MLGVMTALCLSASTQKAFGVNITVKGSATGLDLAAVKKEAVFNARKALFTEHKKIILAWASECFPNADYDFYSASERVALKASSVVSREKVKKRKKTYTVTVYLSYGVDNKTITEQLLDAFEKSMLPKDLKAIGYNRETDRKSLYDIVKRW